MICPKCGSSAQDGTMYCPMCGTSLVPSEGKAPSELNRDWLRGILVRSGYEVKNSENDENALVATHARRANIVITIRRNISLITISSFWRAKKNWGQDKGYLAALNEANSRSWLNTYSMDKDGDVMVSAYMVITARINDDDITNFLDRTSSSFFELVSASGLDKYLK